MVAIIGMFTIYKLQLLSNKHESDTRELLSAAEYREKQRTRYNGKVVIRTQTSLDFINNPKAIESEKRQIKCDEEFVTNRIQEIENRNEREESTPQDGADIFKLNDWGWAVKDEKRVLDRIGRGKDTMMYIKKTFKIPLIASGFLIGISFFLLSFSQESIIYSAQSLFLWFFAGTIGASICLTFMLIKFILALIEV